jgi:hypothetical protein
MTVYDHRDHAAYRAANVPCAWAKNEYILAWWTDEHDEALRQSISDWQWCWYWKVSDALIKITPKSTLEEWRRKDRLCRRFAWYNVLMGFAQARAQTLGLTAAIRIPEWKTCLICEKRFVEDSLPVPIVERLGIGRLSFCGPCVQATVFFNGHTTPGREEIFLHIRALTDAAGRVPPQGFGSRTGDLDAFSDDERLVLLRVLRSRPSKAAIDRNFGSWFDALVEAGVLDDGARRTSRGIQCLAKDGHLCLSLGEKTIDDALLAMGIEHTKEPKYPDSNFRADFDVNGVFIEYFGLAGDAAYDQKSEAKLALAKKLRIRVIAIFPRDLSSGTELKRKLATLRRQKREQPPRDG